MGVRSGYKAILKKCPFIHQNLLRNKPLHDLAKELGIRPVYKYGPSLLGQYALLRAIFKVWTNKRVM